MNPNANPDHEIYKDIAEVLISEEQIRARIAELGAQIGKDYQGKLPIVVALLKGSGIFIADLVRAIPLHLTMDFMGISSYGAGTKSSGVVKITKDLEETIEGRHVIIAEDIIDTGLTLSYLMKMLKHSAIPLSILVIPCVPGVMASVLNWIKY